VEDAFLLPEQVGHLADLPGVAFNDDRLQAEVMIQVHVCGGEDQVMLAMLEFR